MTRKYGYTAVPCDTNRSGKIVDWYWDGHFFDTIEDCENYIANWGSRWIMWSDVKIYKAPVAKHFTIKGKHAVRSFFSER